MLKFLQIRPAGKMVPEDQIDRVYKKYRLQALFGVFIGYMGYYLVRSNFSLSTPYLNEVYGFTKTEIGFITTALTIAYALSKFTMGNLADKANPKRYIATGLVMSAVVNMMFGFTSTFYMFVTFIILNGLFQGMGAAPSYITIAKWFPLKERGTRSAIWNISHNVGGGLVAPIFGVGIAVLGNQYWQESVFILPACIALVIAVIVLAIGRGTPQSEGLPPIEVLAHEEQADKHKDEKEDTGLTAWQILYHYVFKNKFVWYMGLADAGVYLVRFGVLSWLPLYLTQVKGFSIGKSSVAFLIFEWAAIPTTLLAGYMSDKMFKGKRMPLCIISMILIFSSVILYWMSTSFIVVSIAVALIGCLIYIPQLLISVQTVDVVPKFAVGSAVGLRGLLSYLLGTVTASALFGWMIDNYGWDSTFITLLVGIVLCLVFLVLTHVGLEKEKRKQNHANTI